MVINIKSNPKALDINRPKNVINIDIAKNL